MVSLEDKDIEAAVISTCQTISKPYLKIKMRMWIQWFCQIEGILSCPITLKGMDLKCRATRVQWSKWKNSPESS